MATKVLPSDGVVLRRVLDLTDLTAFKIEVAVPLAEGDLVVVEVMEISMET